MLLAALTCLIVGVSDGDTLTARCPTQEVQRPYQQVRIRLAEIDAPESGQPFGKRSKEHLSGLCYQAEAVIRPTTTDRYGRTVARVQCKGVDANLEMVKAGLAWAFTKYQTDPAFPEAELHARAHRIGMWAEPGHVPPWDFRHTPQQLVADADGCYTGKRGGRFRLMPDGRRRYGCQSRMLDL